MVRLGESGMELRVRVGKDGERRLMEVTPPISCCTFSRGVRYLLKWDPS